MWWWQIAASNLSLIPPLPEQKHTALINIKSHFYNDVVLPQLQESSSFFLMQIWITVPNLTGIKTFKQERKT